MGMSRFGLTVSSALFEQINQLQREKVDWLQGRNRVKADVGEKDDGCPVDHAVYAKGEKVAPVARIHVRRSHKDNKEDGEEREDHLPRPKKVRTAANKTSAYHDTINGRRLLCPDRCQEGEQERDRERCHVDCAALLRTFP